MRRRIPVLIALLTLSLTACALQQPRTCNTRAVEGFSDSDTFIVQATAKPTSGITLVEQRESAESELLKACHDHAFTALQDFIQKKTDTSTTENAAMRKSIKTIAEDGSIECRWFNQDNSISAIYVISSKNMKSTLLSYTTTSKEETTENATTP